MGETPVRDYTTLIDHCDIVSTHGWENSVRMVKETPKRGKTLWIFNNGMGRLCWGFYNWRIGSKGRWECTSAGRCGLERELSRQRVVQSFHGLPGLHVQRALHEVSRGDPVPVLLLHSG